MDVTIQRGPQGPRLEQTPAQWLSHRDYLEREGWFDINEPKRKRKKETDIEQPADK